MTKAQEKLAQLTKYITDHPDFRFWQSVANCFGITYLGTASDSDGKNFEDLWNEE
ncbi:MAG: hypothetical protein M0R06_01995 [Sphaerochaeta sp.]|jgi:hypothetical protein|nr:hypothetical protein [Sphaerochaeta sp.]